MKFQEKIAFLQESLKLKDGQFAAKYKIKLSTLKKWKLGEIKPSEKDIILLCKDYHLDPKDFLDDKSSLKDPKCGEHMCATKIDADRPNVIYEDFAREENSRYEEKD